MTQADADLDSLLAIAGGTGVISRSLGLSLHLVKPDSRIEWCSSGGWYGKPGIYSG